jgi:two-component system, cell cycle response regulator
MTNRPITIALLGFVPAIAKRIAMVLGESSKAELNFDIVADPLRTPCDMALVDVESSPAHAALAKLRSAWPALIVVWVSETGSLGDSDFKLERANLFTNLRTVLSEARAKAAIAGGQATDRKSVPEAYPLQIQGALCALVVDDSLTVRQQVQGALNRLGISVEEAADGEMALTKSKLKNYELFVVDVGLPGVDGFTLTKKLHELSGHQKSPVIILTSRSSAIDRVRGSMSGCVAFLTKPINMKDFYIAVDAALMKRADADRKRLLERGYRLQAAPSARKPFR